MKKLSLSKYLILLAFGVTGVIFSYILGQDYYFGQIMAKTGNKLSVFSPFSNAVCGTGKSFLNCSAVSKSALSKFWGLPMAFWGFAFFIAVLAGTALLRSLKGAALKVNASLLFFAVLGGALFDLFLLFYSLIKVKALCPLCLVTYGALWGILAVLIFALKEIEVKPISSIAYVKEMFGTISTGTYYTAGFVFVATSAVLIAIFFNSSLLEARTSFIKKNRRDQIQVIVRNFAREKSVEIDYSKLLLVGNPDAPVTIIEFSDFMCPYCKRTAGEIEKLIHKYPGKVKMYFMNYPLDIGCNPSMKRQLHEGACLLARGSICSARQGRFEQYHNIAFRLRKKRVYKNDMKQVAAMTGLNEKEFMACLDSAATGNELNRQMNTAESLGIHSTPTLFINNKKYKYKPLMVILELLLQQELKMMGK